MRNPINIVTQAFCDHRYIALSCGWESEICMDCGHRTERAKTLPTEEVARPPREKLGEACDAFRLLWRRTTRRSREA